LAAARVVPRPSADVRAADPVGDVAALAGRRPILVFVTATPRVFRSVGPAAGAEGRVA